MVFIIHKNYFCLALNFGLILFITYTRPLLLTNFELRSNNTPIFAKSFDPSDSSVLTLDTGTFNIKDHFFRTDEELIYTPKSTFVGIFLASTSPISQL